MRVQTRETRAEERAEKEEAMSYSFHTNALGFGGVVTSPKREFIPSIASAVLSPTGGFGSATVTGFRYGELISIGEARSELFGGKSRDGYEPRARSLLIDFNLRDVFHADYMEASVISYKPKDLSLPLIRFSAIFEGVTVNGQRIEPELDTPFYNDRQSYDLLTQGFQQRLTAALAPAPDAVPMVQGDNETFHTT